MIYNKDELIDIVNSEIEDREATERNMDPPEALDLRLEITALISMRIAITNEEPLEFTEYQWLADLVSISCE